MPDRPSLFDSPDLTYRMSMLPGATYRNPDGSERLEWALPSMITEPIDALYRLGQNSVLPDGRPGIPNPQNVENQNDVLTGLLSLYGGNAMKGVTREAMALPSLRDTAQGIAGAEAPQRMYHGTAAAEDFSRFKPSESGSLGPGVYLSDNPAFAGTHAGLDDGARVMPLDVSGPFASVDDYLTTLHANGRNPEAAQNALLDQGYTGVSGDFGGPNFANVTNVFKPGSIRSATTGETLFSDTGKPSLFGAAIAGAEGNTPLRAYHGTATEIPIDKFNPDAKRMAGGEDERAVWFSPSADTASRFADVAAANFDNNLAAVYPADIDVSGFKTIAPQNGYDWRSHMTDERGPYQTYNGDFFSNQLKQARDEGHPGVIFQRVWEGPFPEDQIAVLQPGRVRSATTGETLFSDQFPSLFGSALAPYQQEPRNALLNY